MKLETLPGPVLLALLALLGGSPAARAQGFSVNQILLDELDADGNVERRIDDTDADYFNGGRCACATPIRITVQITQDRQAEGTIKIVSGPSDCLTTESEIDTTKCQEHFSERIKDQDRDIELTVGADLLMLEPGQRCVDSDNEQDFNLYVFTDANNQEFTASGVSRKYPVDLRPPDKPGASDKAPQPGEKLVKVFFEEPASSEQNIKYQVLCQQEDAPDSPPKSDPPEPEYDVAATLCATGTSESAATTDGGTDDATTMDGAVDAGTADGATDATTVDTTGATDSTADAAVPEGPIGSLDPRFVCSEAVSGAGSITVSGLQDGVTYRFFAISIDEANNPSSELRDLGTGTPAEEEDLWERYKRSGGQASGCELGTGGRSAAGLLVVLVGIGILLLLRRAGAMLLVLLLLPATARADAAYASPQHFAAEIKFGPYAPEIDSEFSGGATPFADLFGDGTGLLVRGEFDWQIWRGFGSAGLGLSVGYYGKSAEALLDDGGEGQPSSSTKRSAGETTIRLMPLALLAVYRFDPLWDRLSIPLVPFIKFGLGYTLWWIEKGDGSLAEAGGDKARGGSLGLQLSAGAALLLDVFEPSAAKNLDSDLGINHTYAFFEFVHLQADGLGSSSALDVGDTTWQAGLAFEF